MSRRLLRPFFALVAALLLVFSMLGVAIAQTPVVNDDSLRVMTFNIHHGSGNDDCTDPEVPEGEIPEAECALDLERIAEVIRAEDPDIVALQEVDRFWARSGGVDQPAELGAMLEMNVCYGANLSHEPDEHADQPHEYGVLTLSKYEITGCDNTFLPIEEGEEQRGLLDAQIEVDGMGTITVLNSHFDHKKPENRLMQAEAVAEYVDGVEGPVILMGDLNAEPTDMELEPINTLLTDAWSIGGDGSDGFTYPADPAETLEKQIDLIYVSEAFTVNDVYVAQNEVTEMASDHFPVVADLVLEDSGTPAATPVA
jgi:endonuclease/exonuclease/phosphatase family metal-dependent hydrolase